MNAVAVLHLRWGQGVPGGFVINGDFDDVRCGRSGNGRLHGGGDRGVHRAAERPDGAPSHVTTLLPQHPIAAGLPKKWDIAQTEMYDEPFHVPAPDAVVFEEHWDKGEHFRSGCVWRVGKGRIFYFRPGHEEYPVYRQPEPLRVIENAVRWLGRPVE